VKILHLETGRHLYGGARQVGYLLDGLEQFAVQNILVCQPGSPLAAKTNVAACIELPVSGDVDWSLKRRLRRIIREHKPEVVHVHSRRGADIWGGRAAKAEGVPALLTRRVDSTEPRFWLRWKLRPYTAVAAISRAVYMQVHPVCRAPRKMHLLHSAVDSQLFRPDETARARLIECYGLPENARIAGTSAQFIARKGHDLLLPVASRVREQVPEFRLLLFGQGPLREQFEQKVAATGLGDTIHFCGWEQDWPSLLPGLELLLHPARREGLGNVVLEAMASGVPVVASDVGGITDPIDLSVDGLLLPPDDVDGWSRAAINLLGDRKERERLAYQARRTVEQRFTIGNMAMHYVCLYDDLRNNRV
jgi:glycosyltransferase involved in cell wall biosynthesis